MPSVTLQDKIKHKLEQIAPLADEIPGVVIIHNIRDMSVVYMSARGRQILGVDNDELVRMGPAYYQRFFNPSEAEEHVAKTVAMLKANDSEQIVSLFQQVRGADTQEWTWYSTSLKIFMKDDEGNPLLTIAIALPIDPKHHITNKVSRLLDENNFLKKNVEKFSKLTSREKEILKSMALGKTSAEMAAELHISTSTAETHRKNIKRKLQVSSSFDISLYARAFDLI